MSGSLEYGHFDIDSLATSEAVIDTPDGQKTVQYLDRKKIWKFQRMRAERGREVMAPFRQWLICYQSMSANRAMQLSAVLFTALWETENKPWEMFERSDIAPQQKRSIRKAMTLFAEYVLRSESSTAEQREWAHKALSKDQIIRHFDKVAHREKMLGRPLKSAAGMDPLARAKMLDERRAHKHRHLSAEHWNELFDEIETWFRKHGARYPYARVVMRLLLMLGQKNNSTPLFLTERDMLVAALRSKEKHATVRMVTGRGKPLLIPVELFREDFQTLVDWPSPWGIVADILNVRSASENHARSAQTRMTTLWNLLKSQMTPQKATWICDAVLLKNTAIATAWASARSIAVVAPIFGLSPLTMRQNPIVNGEVAPT